MNNLLAGGSSVDHDLRLGCIGSGRHAEANLYPSIAIAGGRVASISTRNQATAEAAARRHGAERGHHDHRVMLAEDHLDAVFVSVDPGDHARIVEDCLRAGVHVFVEKPLGLGPVDARRIADIADETGRTVMVAFMKRFAPAYLRTQQLISDVATFGDVMSMAATFRFAPWTDTLRPDSFLTFAAIHIVDLVRHLFGEVAEVSGYDNSVGADINLAFALRFATGVVGTLSFAAVESWAREHEELVVTGRRGFVVASDLQRVSVHHHRPTGHVPRWSALDEQTVVSETIASTGSGGQRDLYQRGFVGEVAEFLRCISENRRPSCSARDNVGTMELTARLLAAIGHSPLA